MEVPRYPSKELGKCRRSPFAFGVHEIAFFEEGPGTLHEAFPRNAVITVAILAQGTNRGDAVSNSIALPLCQTVGGPCPRWLQGQAAAVSNSGRTVAVSNSDRAAAAVSNSGCVQ